MSVPSFLLSHETPPPTGPDRNVAIYIRNAVKGANREPCGTQETRLPAPVVTHTNDARSRDVIAMAELRLRAVTERAGTRP
jgi:hypothetical protein